MMLENHDLYLIRRQKVAFSSSACSRSRKSSVSFEFSSKVRILEVEHIHWFLFDCCSPANSHSRAFVKAL